MKRRRFLGAMIGAGALALAGCGRGAPGVDLDDAIETTRRTLRELLLGSPPESVATLPVRPDPPLLKAGVYETVLVAADAEGFARVSRGSLTAEAIRDMQRRVVEKLTKDLGKRGFLARGVPFGAEARAEDRALLVTLTPTTEAGGSPQERTTGKGKTYLLVRLTVADARTGAILRVRDYYSGQNVRKPGG